MTQSLRLVGPKTLTSEYSDVTSSYTLPAQTSTNWCTEWTTECIARQNNIYSDNYGFGTYYSYTLATAGTQSGSQSICPKGWRMPAGDTSEAGTNGEFWDLYSYYSSAAALLAVPASFALSGFHYGAEVAGQYTAGYYMATTPYTLNLSSSSVEPSKLTAWFLGTTVRCLAK